MENNSETNIVQQIQDDKLLIEPNKFENLCLGIDFGTTNSCLSVWYKNKSIIITDIDGSEIIPTVIEINSDKKIIGKQAYLRKEIFQNTNGIIENKNIFLIYEIKKLLGKKYSELNKKHIDILAYDLKPDSDDNIIIVDNQTLKSYYPEEIATHLFMSFKLKAELFLSSKFNTQITISDSVISVPAYFNKNQRQIIKNSAEYAGFNVLRLINEPTAAAICYGLGKSNKIDGTNIIVFDFGGGTLDVSLLNINDGVYEVLGSCGNNNLGGSDFDTRLMEYVIKEFISENKIMDFDKFISDITENSLQKLKLLCEQAKIVLSDHTNTKIKIDNFYNKLELNVGLSREKFNDICNDLISIIIKPINDVLEMCEKDKSEIDEIIMVGGMTRVPVIRYNVERYFNKDVNCSINPDNVVSIGSSIQGFMLLNKVSIQDRLLLIDRTSLSIGLETTGGIMDVIIPRGSIIPIKKNKKYSTDTDYVDSINIKIYEGERKFTKDNFLIGNFILSGIEKQKKGIPSIQITFSIDSDGIIKIYAEDLDNPLNKKSIQVSGNKQNLTSEQIEQIIINAKQMDSIDKIDKIKKESYNSIMDTSNKILENLNNDFIKIPEEIKQTIINNVNEIINWLDSTEYHDIEIEKYKEILHDYKINYSIYIIQQLTPIIELESANMEEEKNKGIEIYDDDTNTKIYEDQINYFRKIIDEYENIGKQIKIIKFMSKTKSIDETFNDIIKYEQLDELQKLFDMVFNFASDNLLAFFIDKNLSPEFVDDIVNKLYLLDVDFKEKFNLFDNEFNIISKLINKLEEKENYYLGLLENMTESLKLNKNSTIKDIQQIEPTIESIESIEFIKSIKSIEYVESIELNKIISNNCDNLYNYVKSINDKLDIIMEYQSIIYKMNSGYIESDFDRLTNMLDSIEKI
jgi:molecular chaperone DnaK (HSP70)